MGQRLLQLLEAVVLVLGSEKDLLTPPPTPGLPGDCFSHMPLSIRLRIIECMHSFLSLIHEAMSSGPSYIWQHLYTWLMSPPVIDTLFQAAHMCHMGSNSVFEYKRQECSRRSYPLADMNSSSFLTLLKIMSRLHLDSGLPASESLREIRNNLTRLVHFTRTALLSHVPIALVSIRATLHSYSDLHLASDRNSLSIFRVQMDFLDLLHEMKDVPGFFEQIYLNILDSFPTLLEFLDLGLCLSLSVRQSALTLVEPISNLCLDIMCLPSALLDPYWGRSTIAALQWATFLLSYLEEQAGGEEDSRAGRMGPLDHLMVGMLSHNFSFLERSGERLNRFNATWYVSVFIISTNPCIHTSIRTSIHTSTRHLPAHRAPCIPSSIPESPL